ncbi:MAG: hypothetical protein KBG09_09105 [Syntrophobacterales bacterium]|jgi:hypothetical protein|nr:hypothetical protein [Syntrophobacterales bacterium]
MTSLIIITIVSAVFAVIVLHWRFSGGSYGRLHPNGEVTTAYESFQTTPRLNYYLSGPELYPHALMGIDRDWTLLSDLWKRIDFTSGRMKGLVRGMQTKARENLVRLQGYDIVDEHGMKIGDCFSLPGIHVVIRIKGGNRVEISTPPIDTYERSNIN